MKIGLVSDSHDNKGAVDRVLELFDKVGVAAVVHAGDFVAPFTLKKFIGREWPFYAVFGNNDGERAGLIKLCPGLRDGPTVFEINGLKVGVVHDRAQWDNRPCDIFVFGHTHQCYYKRRDDCLEVNPGELGGWLFGKNTAAIYDTETADAETVEV